MLNRKIFFIVLFFLLFLLTMSTDSFGAVTTADLNSLTETQKETILKVWEHTLWHCNELGVDIDNSYYFITYTTSPIEHATVVVANPEGNTKRQILNNGRWNWCIINYCRPNEEPNQSDGGWGGYYENPYDVVYSVSNGSNPIVIANNIETTNTEYKAISRSYKDVPFLNAVPPSVTTSDSSITNWNFTDLHINSGDYSSGHKIELSVYYASPDSVFWIDDFNNYQIYGYIEKKFVLNDSSEYWDKQLVNSNVNYYIPRSQLFNTATIRNGGVFWYKLNYYDYDGTLLGTITSNNYFIGGLTEDKVTDDTTDKTLGKLDEQIKTSKGIWETIQSILNVLNPASEDFFAYQLINLLIEAIKSLFVPSEEFLNTWINDMNDWLSDRLGVLYYPINLIIDFLTRIGELNETSTAIIKIPQFDLNFMGYTATVIPEYSYDLNSILENDTFKNIHDVYLVIVDVILYLGLVVLSHNTFVDIFGGKYMDDVVQTGYKAYDSYSKQKDSEKKSNYIGFRK